MNLDLLRLVVDFGLVVLIWIVQLIIYPSFLFYQKADLLRWHQTYTVRIGVIVMPLMLVQLGLTIFQLLQLQSTLNIVSLVFVVFVWLITFLLFIPMHSQITAGHTQEDLLRRLIKLNWSRTFLWTVVFILSIISYYT